MKQKTWEELTSKTNFIKDIKATKEYMERQHTRFDAEEHKKELDKYFEEERITDEVAKNIVERVLPSRKKSCGKPSLSS